MSDMIERVAATLERLPIRDNEHRGGELDQLRLREAARAAIAIVIEDCALVAEDEFLLDAHGEPDHSAHNWAVERIAARIRAAPEDSAAQAELEKLCST